MQTQSEDAKPHGKLEVTLEIIILIVTISTFLFNIYQYNTQTSHNLKEQFNRELWMQKKELYTQMCSTLGSIVASSGTESSYKTDLKQFLSLYYGSATFVYDAEVRHWLDEVRLTLATHFDYKNASDIEVLREKLENLSFVCSKVLKNELDKL